MSAEAARGTDLQARHVKPPHQGLTATPSLYPFRGSYKRLGQVSRDLAHCVAGLSPGRSLLWVAAASVGLAFGCLPSARFPRWPVLSMLGGHSGRRRTTERPSCSHTAERNLEISVAFLPFVFTAVAFGPLAAFIVGRLANLSDLRRPYLRWAVYTPIRALTGAAAGLAAARRWRRGSATFGAILVAAFACRRRAPRRRRCPESWNAVGSRRHVSVHVHACDDSCLLRCAFLCMCRPWRCLSTATRSTRSSRSARSLFPS